MVATTNSSMQISTVCRTLLLPIDFAKRFSFVCLVVVIPVVLMMVMVVVKMVAVVVRGGAGGRKGRGGDIVILI